MNRRAIIRSLPALLAYVLWAQAAISQGESKRVPAQMLSADRSEVLFSEGRKAIERPNMVLDLMGLSDGQIVADVGSGPGFYSLLLAERIEPHGVVFAVDVQQGMLDQLKKRMDEAGVANVYPVLGTFTDPNLPVGKVDRVLLVDAYHEFSEPEAMLAKIRESLAPGSLVVLAEFRAEEDSESSDIVRQIPRDHKMTAEEILSEWEPAGFELVQRHETLPAQHLFIFKKGMLRSARVAPEVIGSTLNTSTLGGDIYFGGQPSAADLKTLSEKGVKAVINLRTSQELERLGFDEARTVEGLGMRYIHVPTGREVPGEADLDRIFSALDAAGQAPVLLHCASSNRVN